MRYILKVGLTFQSKSGKQFSSRDDVGSTDISLRWCAETDFPLDLRWVSQNLWSCLKKVKPLVVYDVECQMALEPMQRNWASSQVDLGTLSYFAFLR